MLKDLSKPELKQQLDAFRKEYEKYEAMGLKLDMSRGLSLIHI